MKREPSNGEILVTLQDLTEAVQDFAGNVDQQFKEIKSQMVTKSYLDDKLADQKGSLVNMLRKEDQKVNRLISVLADRKILSTPDAKDVLSFRVFP